MKQAILNNKKELAYVGLGVFRLDKNDNTYNAVKMALDNGYRHIDTAMIYGNEEEVGRAIKDSNVNREDIFLTTKLWNDDIRNNNINEALELSLKKLQVDYVDLYLIHWPVKEKYISAWSEMEKIYNSGKAKSIGVSNYQVHHLEDLLKVCKQVPMVNQFELHPYLVQEELVEFCKANNIQPEAHSPLGAQKNKILEEPILLELGKKYNKTPAQIVLRWDIERGIVTIPKSANDKRQKENLDIFDFSLLPEEVNKINSLNKNLRVASDPDNFSF